MASTALIEVFPDMGTPGVDTVFIGFPVTTLVDPTHAHLPRNDSELPSSSPKAISIATEAPILDAVESNGVAVVLSSRRQTQRIPTHDLSSKPVCPQFRITLGPEFVDRLVNGVSIPKLLVPRSAPHFKESKANDAEAYIQRVSTAVLREMGIKEHNTPQGRRQFLFYSNIAKQSMDHTLFQGQHCNVEEAAQREGAQFHKGKQRSPLRMLIPSASRTFATFDKLMPDSNKENISRPSAQPVRRVSRLSQPEMIQISEPTSMDTKTVVNICVSGAVVCLVVWDSLPSNATRPGVRKILDFLASTVPALLKMAFEALRNCHCFSSGSL